ncbi:MAG: glycosyltransferase family 4 protein [Euryarchaeota archaeon]|nr:glycosyltransferase family 4 protein [Euryarchaeota archaeon]
MRISMLQHRFFPSIGGMQEHVHILGRELVKRGNEVTVYTLNSLDNEDVPCLHLAPPSITQNVRSPGLPETETIDGICVRRFDVALRFWSFIWSPDMFRELKREIDKCDIIHAHGYHLLSSVYGCYLAKKRRKTFVLTGHDMLITDDLPLSARLLKKIYDLCLGRYLLKNASKIIALTEDQIEQYTNRGGDESKITVIPNAIDLEKYGSCEDPAKDTSGKNLLFVGRLEKYKGIQDVVGMMPALLASEPDVRLTIVGGDSGFRHELEGLSERLGVSDTIVFTGEVSRDDLLEKYREADIFVLPSRMEGFGIVLLEAMASGLPCVAYSIPSVRTLIEHGKTGLLAENEEEFLESILCLLKNDRIRSGIRESGLEYVKRYSVGNMADLTEQVYGGDMLV